MNGPGAHNLGNDDPWMKPAGVKRPGGKVRIDWSGARNPYSTYVAPPPLVTLGDSETEQSFVPLQRKYTGIVRAISSELAAVSCASLGANRLLDELNRVQGTSYTLDIPGLAFHIEACITNSYDFGTAYARLRPHWVMDFADLKAELTQFEADDREARKKALVNNQIVNIHVRPRRAWDLYSNRVVPTWIIRRDPWAVSHSWMDIAQRTGIMTPINGFEWPVPIPNDTTLERVRIELLNLDAQYVWLDVLCLRQRGGHDDSLRVEEWKLDVPTIGQAYHQNQSVVCFYSGLGRPFHVGDLESPRHWLNRAWTLQEISENRIVAGIVADSPLDPVVDEEGNYENIQVGNFYQRIGSLQAISQELENVFSVLPHIQNRASESPVDKVAGLAYLLRSRMIPAYYETQSAEDAWDALVRTMRNKYRGDLFLLYSAPGDGHVKWAPSWDQVLTTRLPSIGGIYFFEEIFHIAEEGVDRHKGYSVDNCFLQGLDISNEQGKRRYGEVRVKDNKGDDHKFSIFAPHQQPIPSAYYTLVSEKSMEYWAVGKLLASGKIEKVSVFRMLDEPASRLKKLGIATMRENDWV